MNRMRRLTALLALALALFGLSAAPAQAETFSWRWADTTISVYDATVPGDQVDVPGIIADWNAAGAVTLYRTSDRASAQLVVESILYHPYAGQAIPTRSGDTVTHCRAIVNGTHATKAWAHHIGLHEVGHCLGLDHTEHKGAIMQTSVGAFNYMMAPSRWDLRELRNHY